MVPSFMDWETGQSGSSAWLGMRNACILIDSREYIAIPSRVMRRIRPKHKMGKRSPVIARACYAVKRSERSTEESKRVVKDKMDVEIKSEDIRSFKQNEHVVREICEVQSRAHPGKVGPETHLPHPAPASAIFPKKAARN
ncbi:uncharacterized protein SCHCODRAFT_02542179 [Schizophyllum commune H4-8]|uniref:Uncharacterized protein n=1 Tax=Schizophyllum commune (strain H4-8 / FGSC 9210) TaxID=578458 RepID=D8Q4Z2_SCHCM